MDKHTKAELKRVKKHRQFPQNTCPASRHAEMIGDHLARKKPYAMLREEPEHCACSILSVVASLYETRTLLAEAYAMLATHAATIDKNPRAKWPKGSLLEKAVAYTSAINDMAMKPLKRR